MAQVDPTWEKQWLSDIGLGRYDGFLCPKQRSEIRSMYFYFYKYTFRSIWFMPVSN